MLITINIYSAEDEKESAVLFLCIFIHRRRISLQNNFSVHLNSGKNIPSELRFATCRALTFSSYLSKAACTGGSSELA